LLGSDADCSEVENLPKECKKVAFVRNSANTIEITRKNLEKNVVTEKIVKNFNFHYLVEYQ
jgi:hypothetical protein